jgi:hypothetical protein
MMIHRVELSSLVFGNHSSSKIVDRNYTKLLCNLKIVSKIIISKASNLQTITIFVGQNNQRISQLLTSSSSKSMLHSED